MRKPTNAPFLFVGAAQHADGWLVSWLLVGRATRSEKIAGFGESERSVHEEMFLGT